MPRKRKASRARIENLQVARETFSGKRRRSTTQSDSNLLDGSEGRTWMSDDEIVHLKRCRWCIWHWGLLPFLDRLTFRGKLLKIDHSDKHRNFSWMLISTIRRVPIKPIPLFYWRTRNNKVFNINGPIHPTWRSYVTRSHGTWPCRIWMSSTL